MVTVGFAVTVAPVVALNPVEGDHEYVEAPVAKRDTELPEHIIAEEGVTLTVGNGFTVMVTVAVFVQPLLAVPVIV